MCQMVRYTETPAEAPLATVRERAGTFKKLLAGDWTKVPPISVYHVVTSTSQIDSTPI